jgi:cytochrome c556
MRIGIVGFAAALALLGTAAVSASETKAVGAPDAATAIADRQAGMKKMGGFLQSARGVLQGGGDVKPLAAGADEVAAFAKAIPGLFPEGSLEGSKAKPEVWTNKADFDAKAEALADAAAKFSAAASAGDTAAAGAAMGEVGGACRGCHMTYKGQ